MLMLTQLQAWDESKQFTALTRSVLSATPWGRFILQKRNLRLWDGWLPTTCTNQDQVLSSGGLAAESLYWDPVKQGLGPVIDFTSPIAWFKSECYACRALDWWLCVHSEHLTTCTVCGASHLFSVTCDALCLDLLMVYVWCSLEIEYDPQLSHPWGWRWPALATQFKRRIVGKSPSWIKPMLAVTRARQCPKSRQRNILIFVQ